MDLAAQERATLSFLRQSGMRVCRRCKGGVVKSGGCDKMKWYVCACMMCVCVCDLLLHHVGCAVE